MRLGFVTCHFPPDSIGGGQMQSMRLCEALSEKYHVTVFTRSYSKDLPSKEQTETYVLQRRRMSRIPVLKSLIDLISVMGQIRSSRRDTRVFVSFHIQLAALVVILAKLVYGTKAVVSPRGFEDFDFKWYKKAFQKLIYSHADIILIQSERIRETFVASITPHVSFQKRECINKNVRIFPNGINVPSKSPRKLSERPDHILFIGRLEPIKGIDTLLNAFRLCNQNLKLLIIGNGSQREDLELYANGLNVSFLGKCSESEINLHLNSAKVLVLSSLSENFPNVILEAFCAGVPVIGTRVGAVPELIEDGFNGYLVPPSDHKAMAEKINQIFMDSERLDAMGVNAYQGVMSYDWSRLLSKFDAIVESR